MKRIHTSLIPNFSCKLYPLLIAILICSFVTGCATQENGPEYGDEKIRAWVSKLDYERKHALLIGITKYKAPIESLSNPVFDAIEMAEVLVSRFGYSDVILLIDEEPGHLPGKTKEIQTDSLNAVELRKQLTSPEIIKIIRVNSITKSVIQKVLAAVQSNSTSKNKN